METRKDDLKYMAGCIASGEAAVGMFNSVISVSIDMPMTNDNGERLHWLLTTFGGGMVQSEDFTLTWTLAGPAAEALLKETVPYLKRATSQAATMAGLIVEQKAEG